MHNPLIFLDVDGVLNTHDFDSVAQSNVIHWDKIQLLNSILFETDAEIVLSSAWRYLTHRNEINLDGLDWMFRSHGLKAGAIVGITHQDTPTHWNSDGHPYRFVENERVQQVSRYLDSVRHRTSYVVIDDIDFGFAPCHPFVQTETTVGLTAEKVEEVLAVLKGNTRFIKA